MIDSFKINCDEINIVNGRKLCKTRRDGSNPQVKIISEGSIQIENWIFDFMESIEFRDRDEEWRFNWKK